MFGDRGSGAFPRPAVEVIPSSNSFPTLKPRRPLSISSLSGVSPCLAALKSQDTPGVWDLCHLPAGQPMAISL